MNATLAITCGVWVCVCVVLKLGLMKPNHVRSNSLVVITTGRNWLVFLGVTCGTCDDGALHRIRICLFGGWNDERINYSLRIRIKQFPTDGRLFFWESNIGAEYVIISDSIRSSLKSCQAEERKRMTNDDICSKMNDSLYLFKACLASSVFSFCLHRDGWRDRKGSIRALATRRVVRGILSDCSLELSDFPRATQAEWLQLRRLVMFRLLHPTLGRPLLNQLHQDRKVYDFHLHTWIWKILVSVFVDVIFWPCFHTSGDQMWIVATKWTHDGIEQIYHLWSTCVTKKGHPNKWITNWDGLILVFIYQTSRRLLLHFNTYFW